MHTTGSQCACLDTELRGIEAIYLHCQWWRDNSALVNHARSTYLNHNSIAVYRTMSCRIKLPMPLTYDFSFFARQLQQQKWAPGATYSVSEGPRMHLRAPKISKILLGVHTPRPPYSVVGLRPPSAQVIAELWLHHWWMIPRKLILQATKNLAVTSKQDYIFMFTCLRTHSMTYLNQKLT